MIQRPCDLVDPIQLDVACFGSQLCHAAAALEQLPEDVLARQAFEEPTYLGRVELE
jgi:hypothetical protein